MESKKPIGRVPSKDIEKSSAKFADYYLNDMQNIATKGIDSPLPTPTHEPVMPAEVFYNAIALDDGLDIPDM